MACGDASGLRAHIQGRHLHYRRIVTANPRWTDDELLLALEVADRREWRAGNKTTPDFVALSRLLRAVNLPGVSTIDETFRSPSSVSLKVSNLVGANRNVPGGMRDSKREIALVEHFLRYRESSLADAVALRARLASADVDLNARASGWDEEELSVATEGGADYVITLRRERSAPLRQAKIRDVERRGGPIACEACAFDFYRQYGDLGESYIEVHHRTPLHVSGVTESALADLALLCSNCHRMVHRRGWISVESISALVRSRW